MPASDTVGGPARAAVLAYLQTHGEGTAAAVHRAHQGLGYKAVSNAMTRLSRGKAPQVERVPGKHGCYRLRSKAVQGTMTVTEYGHSVPFTGKRDDLGEHPVTEVSHRVLKNDGDAAIAPPAEDVQTTPAAEDAEAPHAKVDDDMELPARMPDEQWFAEADRWVVGLYRTIHSLIPATHRHQSLEIGDWHATIAALGVACQAARSFGAEEQEALLEELQRELVRVRPGGAA